MPIAELLAAQIDMPLLLKLSFSMATVLLVSWAYRFYTSRNSAKTRLRVEDRSDRHTEECRDTTCQNCKMPLQPRGLLQRDDTDGGKGKQPGPPQINSAPDKQMSKSNNEQREVPLLEQPRNAESHTARASYANQHTSMEGETLSQIKQAEVTTSNISFGSSLNLPSPRECGLASPMGRRSPCFLQRLRRSVGVGRELRQDLACQGGYSSFLSKAEIKVEDANLVLEGTGDRQIVRGKIYDYYVESSSHSITDSNHMLGYFERKSSDSQPVDFESHGVSLGETPSSVSPMITRNLFFSQRTDKEPLSVVSPEPQHPTRPVLLRKESYLSAAEHSQLPIPSPTPRGSPLNRSRTGPLEEPITANLAIRTFAEPPQDSSLENVAGAPFFHLPAQKLDSTDLEGLKSKLDLGNCMDVLGLAKKYGWDCLEQAALGVMSDNYLQVLRDPSLYGRLMAGEREQIQKQRMRGRRFVLVADMDPRDWAANTGRQTTVPAQREMSSSLYYYDDYKDAWHPLCPIPKEVISKGCAMCTMDNYLFVAVGCQGTEREMIPSKQMFCFNPATSIWKEISPMNEARPHCKLAALQGHLYAIGGECLSTVERYDPRTDRWTFVAPLPNDTFAVAHHATVCNGELFVSGGTLRYTLLRYSPKTNTWRSSLIVGRRDRTTEMVAVRNFLYRFDVNPLLGISVYRYHTVARLWYQCSTNRLLRCPSFQCVAVANNIYCISRQFTMRFKADEISPAFIAQDMSVLPAPKGILFPFVLSFPDKQPAQTCV